MLKHFFFAISTFTKTLKNGLWFLYSKLLKSCFWNNPSISMMGEFWVVWWVYHWLFIETRSHKKLDISVFALSLKAITELFCSSSTIHFFFFTFSSFCSSLISGINFFLLDYVNIYKDFYTGHSKNVLYIEYELKVVPICSNFIAAGVGGYNFFTLIWWSLFDFFYL